MFLVHFYHNLWPKSTSEALWVDFYHWRVWYTLFSSCYSIRATNTRSWRLIIIIGFFMINWGTFGTIIYIHRLGNIWLSFLTMTLLKLFETEDSGLIFSMTFFNCSITVNINSEPVAFFKLLIVLCKFGTSWCFIGQDRLRKWYLVIL